MVTSDTVVDEVRALSTLDLHELRREWALRYGRPPRMRSRELLSHLLAWKIQADAYGGLDGKSVRLLAATPPKPKGDALPPGTRLTREWRGRRYDVEVVVGGFQHDGQVYGSLSAVARKIAGTRWNGPRFFGLRRPPS